MRTRICTLCTVVALVSGCSDLGSQLVGSHDDTWNASVNGLTLVYHIGQSFKLELDENCDAGYRWDCELGRQSAVCLDSTSYQAINPPFIDGGLCLVIFHFRTTQGGECTITLVEHRPWESGVPPLHSLEFRVRVR
jgi:predicted secreted protein